MMRRLFQILPFGVAGLGLAAVVYAFIAESQAFRAAVLAWAARDLAARTELAAQALDEPLATGDFRRLRAFGDDCRKEGVRLTVMSSSGGMIYDTSAAAHGQQNTNPEVAAACTNGVGQAFRRSSLTGEPYLYCARRLSRGIVRLALPETRVFAPVDQSCTPTLLAGLVGVCAFLFVSLGLGRLRARYRALARERDAQARRLAELTRAEDFRRAFVSDVTHEIKTPLTGILTAVDLLADPAGTDAAERPALLALVRREAQRLNTLVTNILSLARLEQAPEAFPHTFAEADLTALAEEVIDRFRLRAGAVQLRLAEGTCPTCPCVCDAALVGQALVNLVENALRYSQAKEIWLGVACAGEWAELTVEDHGVGIPPADRARVFERFYRVDKARSRELGGTGLGLAIVKHIARVHGGEASLQEPPGGGCRFTLTLRRRGPEGALGREQDKQGKEQHT